MKILFLLSLFFSLQISYSQKVNVSGIAQTSDKRGNILIVLNDTLQKLPKNFPTLEYQKIWKNEDLVRFSDDNGNFSFTADIKDKLVFSELDYISQTHTISDLLSKKDSIKVILQREPCVEYIPCNEVDPDIYIFIGKKIEVSPVENQRYCNSFPFDSKNKSKYKILKKFSKNIDFKIIDFVSYDHASMVRYDEFENVLLFVGKYCNELIHQKYQYQPVYKMKNGRWAIPVFEEYDTTKRKSNKEPHKVEMAEPITVTRWQSHQKLEVTYPEPYFEINEGKVYMRYGYYPEDLITK
ncbi:hypothetical protein [Flavobacterium anhuiense]|uniref:hypothetical protein n=1 Tax=Flavobacterium anhuiense TaxID=459526 RepID=UPI003D992CF8